MLNTKYEHMMNIVNDSVKQIVEDNERNSTQTVDVELTEPEDIKLTENGNKVIIKNNSYNKKCVLKTINKRFIKNLRNEKVVVVTFAIDNVTQHEYRDDLELLRFVTAREKNAVRSSILKQLNE